MTPSEGAHDGAGSSAYVSWLQNALQQQAAILSERDQTIADLNRRLAEATEMLSMTRTGDSGEVDPEGFLIDRIVDEEEKNVRLEEKARQDARLLLEKEESVAALSDEVGELKDALRVMRSERYTDVVKTHAEWAKVHLVHSPANLPVEAIEVLLEDVQARRTDVLHVMQKLEDWHNSLSSNYFSALRVQGLGTKGVGHTPTTRTSNKVMRGKDGVTSFTSEIRKRSDALFNRLRGESLTITHDEISALATGHLSRCRADTSSFLTSFRHIKSILQGAGLTDASNACWLREDMQAERAMLKLDTSLRAQLIESTRELVLSYDSNPRSTQSNHGRLIEELNANLHTLVVALRVSTSETQSPVSFPSTLLDSRLSGSSPASISSSQVQSSTRSAASTSRSAAAPRRVNSAGPSPAAPRMPSPHLRVNRSLLYTSTPSGRTPSRLTTPRSISPYSRQSTAPAPSVQSLIPSPRPLIGGYTRRSQTTRVPSTRVLSHESPPAASAGVAKASGVAEPPVQEGGKVVPPPAFSPTSPSTPPPPPPRPDTRAHAKTHASPQSPKEPTSPLHAASDPPPRPTRGTIPNGMRDAPAVGAAPADEQAERSSAGAAVPRVSEAEGGQGGQGVGMAPAAEPKAAPHPVLRGTDDSVAEHFLSGHGDPSSDYGFLSAAQRREVKERAMGNYRAVREDEDDTPNSRAEMMQQLLSWRGELNSKLAQRDSKPKSAAYDDDYGGRDAYGAGSEEIWSDDNDGDDDFPENRAWSPGSVQEFDSPLNITHPDYSDPDLSAGPSILRGVSATESSRNVKFAEGV